MPRGRASPRYALALLAIAASLMVMAMGQMAPAVDDAPSASSSPSALTMTVTLPLGAPSSKQPEGRVLGAPLSRSPRSLGGLFRDQASKVTSGVKAFISNTISDVKAIAGTAAACTGFYAPGGKLVDDLTKLAFGVNAPMVGRGLTDPLANVVASAYQAVAERLKADPKPTLWKFDNAAAIFAGGTISLTQVTSGASFSLTKRSMVFVPGEFQDGSLQQAFDRFYAYIKYYRDPQFGGTWDIYLLAYNVSMPIQSVQDAINAAVTRAANQAGLAGSFDSIDPIVTAAVMWRELERRAALAGQYLGGLLSALPSKSQTSFVGPELTSHSLGGQTILRALETAFRIKPNLADFAWSNFAPAFPVNACPPPRSLYYGPVYHSYGDALLNTVYPLATSQAAAGAVGISSSCDIGDASNNDLTARVGDAHDPLVPGSLGLPGGYFDRYWSDRV